MDVFKHTIWGWSFNPIAIHCCVSVDSGPSSMNVIIFLLLLNVQEAL